MPDYRLTIHGEQAPKPITVSLPDDDSAWDYAESIMRRLLSRDARKCETWTMVITEGSREVASIGFDLKALKERRTVQ
jgi:hypothetical protein